MKALEVTMPDGSVWQVPASVVAEPRARYYAERDAHATSGPEFDEAYRNELECANSVLIDWAQNNMNWEDVGAVARQVRGAAAADLQEGWVNGPMRVVNADPVLTKGAH